MLKARISLVVTFGLLLTLLIAQAIAGCAEGQPQAPADVDAGVMTTKEPTDPSPSKPAAEDSGKPKPSNPDEADVPEVTSIAPNKATVGSVGPSIIVSGNNFAPRSIVQLDGAPLATSFVSATELRATIPGSKLTAVGTLRVSVGTAPPGGGASKELPFNVENPAPQVTSLTPLSVLAGAGATQLEVNGSAFVSGAKIVFGMTDLTTTLVSSSSLKATIPATLLATSGSVPVTVVNPAPGGGTSTPISFTISNPSATIQNINPVAAFVGSAAFELTVNGGGFVQGSAVLFNGTALTTTFVGSTKLKATVGASSLTAAGDFPIAVQNPPPGGGVSAPVVFKVQYPAPTISSLSPSSVAAGTGPTEVTITGIGFFVTSQVTFDGAPAATTLLDSTHVKATLTASQVATAGTISVRVVNPAPGGGTSSALPFTMMNGVPSITSLTPGSVTVGSPNTTVTLYGTNFLPSSTVTSNGVNVSTGYISGGQLTIVVPANQLLNAGNVAIVVTNPSPGGGTSQTATLTVGCDTSGTNVLLSSLGATYSLSTNLASGTGLMSRWGNAGSCTTAPLYTDVLQPGRYTIVQNMTGAPVTLSAWADCTADGKQGDAYLTFYRRPTIPANDNDRLGCAFVVSEGTNGAGGYASPESGASAYCPGLTKANGGGLQLGVCEKAVVHIQAYDYTSTTFTPPPVVRVRAE